MKTRSSVSPISRAKKASLSALSSSCRLRKADSGLLRPWCRFMRCCKAQRVPARGGHRRTHSSETACRYTFDDGVGEIGIIAPVSQSFCGQCSRVRLTSDGKIRTCLFSQSDHDLYGVMRRGGNDADLDDFIAHHRTKEARHHIGEPGFLKPSRSMVHIGG